MDHVPARKPYYKIINLKVVITFFDKIKTFDKAHKLSGSRMLF